MIERLRDALAPRRVVDSETGYRRLLRWAALPVTDRRWAAPLTAVALGFGLFAGVAIGPGATGTLATAPYQLIEMPSLGGGADDGEDESPPEAAAPQPGGSFGGGEEESPSTFTPIVPVEEPLETGGEEESPSHHVAEEKAPSQPEKQELAGTVVHVNPAASSYTVAETGGVMSAVHAGKLPPLGTAVEVPIKTLANGTLAEAGKRKKTGSKKGATLAGIVTFVDADPAAPAYTVSNKGTSLLVKVHPDPTGAAPLLPALGAYASVSVEIEALEVPPQEPATVLPETAPTSEAPAAPTPSCVPSPAQEPVAVEPKGVLWQSRISGGGAPFTHGDFEGIVTAVCLETAQTLISADDLREAGQDLIFVVPPEIDATELTVGDSVLAAADIAADGTLTLTGLASDERLKGADDQTATQGDLVPEKSKGQE